MKKKIIFILLTLIMLGTIAYFYVNKILLPGKIKGLIQTKIEELTDRPTSIGKVRFKLTKGISLENILIRERDSSQTFLQVDEIHFSLLLAPFLKNKRIVIPAVTIKRPITKIIQELDGSYNLSEFIPKKSTDKTKNTPNIYVTNIRIMDGSVDFIKRGTEQDFAESFRNLNIELALSLNKEINFKVQSQIPLEKSTLSVSGYYQIDSKKFNSQVSLKNINLIRYFDQFVQSDKIQILNGRLSNADIQLNFMDSNPIIKANAYLTGSKLIVNKNKTILGDIRLLNTQFHKENENMIASGEFRIPSAKLNIDSRPFIEGDIQSIIKSLTISKDDLTLNGNIKANNVTLFLKKNQIIKSHVLSRDSTININKNEFNIFGNFDFKDSSIVLSDNRRFEGTINAENLSLKFKNKELTLKSALSSDNSQLIIGKNKLLNGHLSTENLYLTNNAESLSLSSVFQLTETVLSMDKGTKFQGNPNVDLSLSVPYAKTEDMKLKGLITLENGLLLGLPKIETASNIKGSFKISNDRIHSQSIAFNTENTNIELSGQVKNPSKPEIAIKASTKNVELARLRKFFPQFFNKHDIDLNGQAAVNLSFKGLLEDINDSEINVNANLKDTTLNMPKIPDGIQNIRGLLSYEKNKIQWKNLQGLYKSFPFSLSGDIQNFSKPVIETVLQSDDLKIFSEIHLFNNTIRFPKIDAKYFNSDFTGSADIYLFESVEPDIQLNGQSTLYCSDFSSIFPKLKETIDPLGLEGVINTNIFFKGKAKDWQDWSLSIDGKTPSLLLKDHPLKDVKITYLQRDKNISKLNLSSILYNGKLNITSSTNLESDQFPFKAALELYGLDLAELVRVQKMRKNNKLAGKLTTEIALAGEFKDQQSWEGQGSYNISEGYIWQLKIIEGLSSVMLIPEFKNTVYTSSDANFDIKNRRFETSNLRLNSETMSILAKGWIGFDKRIEFDVTPNLSEITIIQSESVKKWTSSFLSQNINLIKVTGTLDKPKYKADANPIKVLKDTTSIITEGVTGIIEGIFKP